MLEVNRLFASLEDKQVLKGINFTFLSGKKYAIMGESGSGKTTLAKAISGLVTVESGHIFFKNQLVKGPHEVLIPGQGNIAYLSQFFEIPLHYIVKDYLRFENNIPNQDEDWLIKICRIDHLLERKTYDMSGGERQRVALAKKLMALPELFVLDEPFAHLDFSNRQIMRSILDEFQSRYVTNFIFITHDFADVFAWADELLIIHNGQLHEVGSPRALYERPADAYTASLLGPWTLADVDKFPFPISKDQLSGKQLFLRPDFFELNTGDDSVIGIICSVHFNGYAYWCEVKVDTSVFRVNFPSFPPPIGTLIPIKYRSQFIWTLT